nr:uncharacterized protein LOC106037701 isoform X2 [Anser cygnoides]
MEASARGGCAHPRLGFSRRPAGSAGGHHFFRRPSPNANINMTSPARPACAFVLQMGALLAPSKPRQPPPRGSAGSSRPPRVASRQENCCPLRTRLPPSRSPQRVTAKWRLRPSKMAAGEELPNLIRPWELPPRAPASSSAPRVVFGACTQQLGLTCCLPELEAWGSPRGTCRGFGVDIHNTEDLIPAHSCPRLYSRNN